MVEAWAFIDAIIRPAQAFRAVGKLSKPIWLIILGVAFVLGLYAAAYGGITGILSVAAFVAAAIYLADMRPKAEGVRPRQLGTTQVRTVPGSRLAGESPRARSG